jgi:hypothetical protein
MSIFFENETNYNLHLHLEYLSELLTAETRLELVGNLRIVQTHLECIRTHTVYAGYYLNPGGVPELEFRVTHDMLMRFTSSYVPENTHANGASNGPENSDSEHGN